MPIAAAAFAISFILPALIVVAALKGGVWLIAPPVYAFVITSVMDRLIGRETRNPDPATGDEALFWHRALIWLWVPCQIALLIFCLYVAAAGRLTGWELIWLFSGVGVATGGIGIVYAHELIHQRSRWERRLGELMLATVGYAHFATEHMLGHHVNVGTPKDAVTARYAEGFWRFLPRAVVGSAVSAWRIEAARQRRRGAPALGLSNPWWRYGALTLAFLALAWAIAGWAGVGLMALQAAVAVLQLEAVNYVEHYGLTRKHLGDGAYEPTRAHHSWNADHGFTNLMLINLQRHSDHHARPDRRYPLLQTYGEAEAPQLPYGYPVMVLFALNPPVWFRVMNRRVKDWRRRHYPEIDDWSPYKAGTTPIRP